MNISLRIKNLQFLRWYEPPINMARLPDQSSSNQNLCLPLTFYFDDGSCDEFKSMLDDCCLFHLPTQGSPYTWVKKSRFPHLRLERRLDRAMCDSQWLHKWPSSSCVTHVKFDSDHNPLVLIIILWFLMMDLVGVERLPLSDF